MPLKIRRFVILFISIQLVGLKSGFGTYTPSLKRYYFRQINKAIIDPKGLWLRELFCLYHSYNGGTWNFIDLQNLVQQAIVPSAMVDSKGDLYTVNFECVESTKGAKFLIRQVGGNEEDFYPWELIANETINLDDCPDYSEFERENNYSAENDFRDYLHNAFQPCIAQEVGGDSNYLYVFFYIPPTYFMGISRYENSQEGILKVKIKKSDLSIASYELLKGGYHEVTPWSFRQLCPRALPGFIFGPQWGNFQAWANGDNDVNLLWLCLLQKNNPESIISIGRWSSNLSPGANFLGPLIGAAIGSRFIHLNNWIFGIDSWASQRILLGYSQNQLFPTIRDSFFNYLEHNREDYTPKCYDFCIIDGQFCVLGLSPTSQTDDARTSLSGERWTSKYINEPSKIVLMLSSLTSNNNYYEDPQNIIYSTGQNSFTTESCSIDCGCHRVDDSTYHSEQLFKNTHKLVTYTSESGSKYIIYCYCYPGKSEQLFLGYAPYYVANNKVHLLTKTEFKTPSSDANYPMGKSFGNFTSCSRIISMDCKNGQLWITWMNADNTNYYCFHIAAKDLIGE